MNGDGGADMLSALLCVTWCLELSSQRSALRRRRVSDGMRSRSGVGRKEEAELEMWRGVGGSHGECEHSWRDGGARHPCILGSLPCTPASLLPVDSVCSNQDEEVS